MAAFWGLLVGAALGLGVPPAAVLGVLAVLASLVLSVRRLEALFVAVVLAFLLPSLSFSATSDAPLGLRWVLQGVVLLALVARLATRRFSFSKRTLPAPLLAIAILGLASTTWSIAPRLSLGRALAFASMIAVLALVGGIERAPGQLRTGLAVVASLVSLGSVATLPLAGGVDGRYTGVFENPNALGVAAALLFPFTFHEALSSETRQWRAFNGVVAALLAGEAFAAASRGALLAITAAYLYLAWGRFRQAKGVRRCLVVLPAVIALVASLTVVDTQRFSTANSRASLWAAFPSVFTSSPLVGQGFGTTEVALVPFSAQTGYLDPGGVNFHNSYLNLLSDLGLIGALCFVLLLLRVAKNLKVAPPALVATVLAGLVSAMFESWLLAVGSGFAFVFWFAVVEVATTEHRRTVLRCGRPPR